MTYIYYMKLFINVKSGQKSKISCRCSHNLGFFSVFLGCKWKLEESNCPSLLFSLASDSADLDDTFANHLFTGHSSEQIETLGDVVEDLKQKLEQVEKQSNSQIQVAKGINTFYNFTTASFRNFQAKNRSKSFERKNCRSSADWFRCHQIQDQICGATKQTESSTIGRVFRVLGYF